jgi:hypothetical protein
MRTRRSWHEKLAQDEVSKIVPVPPKWRKRFGSGTMLIPRPRDVDALMRKVRKGRLTTVASMGLRLAADRGADAACPLTTGIFVRIAAEAAEDDRAAGKKRITPYWRVIKSDGSLNPKFPGGTGRQASRLRDEGFKIVTGPRGGAGKVVDFAKWPAVF